MTLEAILFGGIGAISECADLDRAAWNGAFRAQGLDWDWSWDTYQRLLATRDNHSPVTRYAVQRRCTVDIAAVERTQSHLFAAMLAEGLPLRPGVAAVIMAAAGRGLKLGLVSRSATEPVRAMLKATARVRGGVGFDVAILRDDLLRLPPHPEAYQLALAQIGVLPSAALAVVDTAAAMQAASAAGIGALGFPGALARSGRLGVPGCGGEVAVLSMSEVDAAWRRSLRQAAE